jgi:pre-60S factor REI1
MTTTSGSSITAAVIAEDSLLYVSSDSSSTDQLLGSSTTLHDFTEGLSTDCLFCPEEHASHEAKMHHMTQSHGFFIPSVYRTTIFTALLNHLWTTINQHYTCVYCRKRKPSLQAIRTHMRDSGHCKIDLDADANLLQLWKEASPRLPVLVPTLKAAGDVASRPRIGSRSPRRTSHRQPARPRSLLQALPPSTDPRFLTPTAPTQTSTIAAPSTSDARANLHHTPKVRGETGLVGVSAHQRRVLLATDKKNLETEARLSARSKCHVQKEANKQKTFRIDAPAGSVNPWNR